MEFIYDSENNEFTVDIEDVFQKDSYITYIIPTKNPAAEFAKCFAIAVDMHRINNTLQQFLFNQVETVPQNLIHQALYDIMINAQESHDEAMNTPLDPEDKEEERLKGIYLDTLQSEIKHIRKYLKFSHETLKQKVYLGIVELNGEDCLARFYIDHVNEAILTLSFTLSRTLYDPEGQPPHEPRGESVEPKPEGNNVVSLPFRKKAPEETPTA